MSSRKSNTHPPAHHTPYHAQVFAHPLNLYLKQKSMPCVLSSPGPNPDYLSNFLLPSVIFRSTCLCLQACEQGRSPPESVSGARQGGGCRCLQLCPAWWKERTEPHILSSDRHTCAKTHADLHIHTRKCTHTHHK